MFLRKVELVDIDLLVKLSKETFSETFASSNTKEDLENYLLNNCNSNKLIAEHSNKNSNFFFAFYEGTLAGYLKINFGDAQTEKNHPTGIEIERVYVLNKFHGLKIGKAFLNKAKEIAKEMAKKYVWLGVWEKNKKAILFYEKNNFIQFGQHDFMLGNDKQIDLLYKLIL